MFIKAIEYQWQTYHKIITTKAKIDKGNHMPNTCKRTIIIRDPMTDTEFKQLKKTIKKLIKKQVLVTSYIIVSKQVPALITEAVVYSNDNTYFRCPSCKSTMEREYQKYCDRCGQRLKWPSLRKIKYTQV